jgi:hypothetical protein
MKSLYMLWSQYKLAMKRCSEFLRKHSNFANWNSDFLIFSDIRIKKKKPTGISGIKNGIGIPLPMGVPEIGTKNWNSQPRSLVLA